MNTICSIVSPTMPRRSQQGKAYSRFAAYAILEHGGDYKKGRRSPERKGFWQRRRQSVASTLVGLVEGELFHTPADDAYITVKVGDHKETMKIESKGFKSYLGYLFYYQDRRQPVADGVVRGHQRPGGSSQV